MDKEWFSDVQINEWQWTAEYSSDDTYVGVCVCVFCVCVCARVWGLGFLPGVTLLLLFTPAKKLC